MTPCFVAFSPESRSSYGLIRPSLCATPRWDDPTVKRCLLTVLIVCPGHPDLPRSRCYPASLKTDTSRSRRRPSRRLSTSRS